MREFSRRAGRWCTSQVAFIRKNSSNGTAEMCGDLIDPNNPNRQQAAAFFGGAFGFDPAAALNVPGNVVTELSEVVVTAPKAQSQDPIVIMPPTIMSIPEINIRVDDLSMPNLSPLPPLGPYYITQPTPCVARSPAGVSMQELNDAAHSLATSLAFKYMVDKNEWGGFILKMPDGRLVPTHPFTSGSDASIQASVMIPSVAKIVAYIHVHPWDGSNQTTPSSNGQGRNSDEVYINALAESQHGDPDLISYIVTPGDQFNRTIDFYAYDRDHLHNPPTGCQLKV
jgi:hypothetical protein